MSEPVPGSVLLVGAGKMGGGLLKGWLDKGWAPRLTVTDPNPSADLLSLAATHGFAVTTVLGAIVAPEVIVLAIKPQMLEAAAPALAGLCAPETVLISILAGKTIADLTARLPAGAIIRAMPNTPASVGRGITGAYPGPSAGPAQQALAEALLGCVGPVEWLADEGLMDAVTAVSGSGPAYVFLLVESLAEAGQAVGLDAVQAERFARATVVGAGALLHAAAETPAGELRRNVTSPGGTTAAALDVLMGPDALADLMRRAVTAARDRARALAG